MIRATLVLHDRAGSTEVVESLRVCPRAEEHIFLNEKRYRVIQTQHHIGQIPSIRVICIDLDSQVSRLLDESKQS